MPSAKAYVFYAPGCTRGGAGTWFKVPLPTMDRAWQAARDLQAKTPPRKGYSLNAYKCQFADHYHVGHVKHLPSFDWKI